MTQTLKEEYSLDFSPEELKQMSKILAETLLQQLQSEDSKAELTVVTCVSGYEIIKEDQITEVVNLDLIASATAGVLDPLGQLKDFFAGIIDGAISLITSGIETFINNYVLPAIDAVTSGIRTFINNYVLPAIDAVTSGITNFIRTYVLPAIDAVASGIEGFINDYVLPAIDTVTSGISNFIKTHTSHKRNFRLHNHRSCSCNI